MSDIVEFLKARIDEDEAAAQGVRSFAMERPPERWDAVRVGPELSELQVQAILGAARPHAVLRGLSPLVDKAIAKHIARWDPARVLAECAAKRAIVEAARLRAQQGMEGDVVAERHATGLRIAIRHLAAVYADHPDYDPEWRP